VRLFLISEFECLISEPPFPSWERRFFVGALATRAGQQRKEKKRKTGARGFEKKFATFLN
jgi:hypothetical protein